MFDYFEDSYPPINVFETEDAFYILLFAPNVDMDSLKIIYKDGAIFIKGYLKDPLQLDKPKYYYIMEAAYGFFIREIRIGESINEKDIKSTYKQGVLVIVLPKQKPEVKEIEIDEG